MVRQVEAIFTQGAFRPIEPLAIAEGTRVHLSVETPTDRESPIRPGVIRSPKLAHTTDAADFIMSVQEPANASV